MRLKDKVAIITGGAQGLGEGVWHWLRRDVGCGDRACYCQYRISREVMPKRALKAWLKYDKSLKSGLSSGASPHWAMTDMSFAWTTGSGASAPDFSDSV